LTVSWSLIADTMDPTGPADAVAGASPSSMAPSIRDARSKFRMLSLLRELKGPPATADRAVA
jgi:hypothetical protein